MSKQYKKRNFNNQSTFPALQDLPLPSTSGRRSTRQNPDVIDIDLTALMTGPRTRSAISRMTRTKISRNDAIEFLTELLDRIGVEFQRFGRQQFYHPYRDGEVLYIPTTAEELISLYNTLSQFHDAYEATNAIDLSTTPMESVEESETYVQPGNLLVNDEIVNETVVEDAENSTLPPNNSYSVYLWVSFFISPIVETVYQDIDGPYVVTPDDFVTLNSTDAASRHNRVLVVQKYLGEREESMYVDIDAGIHNSSLTAAPTVYTSSNASYNDNIYQNTGYGNLQTRLSYNSNSYFVDHPRIHYCSQDIFDKRMDPIKDPYLRQNYISNVCWMSNIIELMNTNSKASYCTYESLWKIMGKPGMFDPLEAQKGLSVEDMIPVFDFYDRSVHVYDANNSLIYKRKRSEKRRKNHIRPETWDFLVTEHHVYILNKPIDKSLCTKITPQFGYSEVNDLIKHPYEKLSPLILRNEYRKPIELRTNKNVVIFLGAISNDKFDTLENILFHPRYNDASVTVLVEGCLSLQVLIPLVQKHHYVPNVHFYKNKITNIMITSFDTRPIILFRKVDLLTPFQDESEYKNYLEHKHNFKLQLMKYSSTFNESTASILYQFVRGGFSGWFNKTKMSTYYANNCTCPEIVNSCDVNRIYPFTLLLDEIPTVSVFDHFLPIENFEDYEKKCQPHDLCLVEFYDTATIYSDRSTSLCYKKNLDKFLKKSFVYHVNQSHQVPMSESSDGQTFVRVIAYLPTKLVKCNLTKNIKNVWENEDLPRALRKAVLNQNIGKLGTASNSKHVPCKVFTTYVEAQDFKERYNAEFLPIYDDLFLCHADGERVPRLEGGFLLHLWVLDHYRLMMQELYDNLTRTGIDVLYCRCDEFYYPSFQENLVESFLCSDNMKDTFESFGKLKAASKEINLGEVCPRNHCVGENTDFLVPGGNAMKMVEDMLEMNKISQQNMIMLQEIVPYPNEYKMENIKDFTRLLIKANVPGAGKSHSVLSKFADETIVVCPTNALCVEFENKYAGCRAITLHRFLRINSLQENENQLVEQEAMEMHRRSNPFDTDGMESNKVLLLDEIFMYPFKLLVKLQYRLRMCNAKAIYATGDLNQLPPVDEEYDWMKEARLNAIHQMFPNQMTLTKCKRMHEEQDNRLMEDLCKSFFTMKTVAEMKLLTRMSFRDISLKMAIESLQNDDFVAVCYYNRTCHQIAHFVLPSKVDIGVQLVNRKRFVTKKKGKVLNINYEYKVVHVGDKHVSLENIHNQEIIEGVPKFHVMSNMHWYKTRTCHSLQGSSLSSKLLIFDFNSKHITKEFLYVALTRARNISEIYIVNNALN